MHSLAVVHLYWETHLLYWAYILTLILNCMAHSAHCVARSGFLLSNDQDSGKENHITPNYNICADCICSSFTFFVSVYIVVEWWCLHLWVSFRVSRAFKTFSKLVCYCYTLYISTHVMYYSHWRLMYTMLSTTQTKIWPYLFLLLLLIAPILGQLLLPSRTW